MSFSKRAWEGFEALTCETLTAEGVTHGFSGCELISASGADFMSSTSRFFSSQFGAAHVFIPNQVHGCDILDLTDERATEELARIPINDECWKADAIIFNIVSTAPSLFAVKTADCVPLIMRSGSVAAVVHAGWRGLASGIIQKTLGRVRTASGGQTVTVAIGPCARACCYEIGEDVVAAIGQKAAVIKPGRPGKVLLDTGETAATILGSELEVFDCGICTICNPSFHSYRRDSSSSGRNISWVLQTRSAAAL